MWRSLIVIKPESNWKFTPEIEGVYFRLRHINPPKSPVGWVAQAEAIPNTDFHQLFEIQRINGLSRYEILKLTKPLIFATKKLAFRQDTKLPNDWLIEVEVCIEMPIVDLQPDQPPVNAAGSSSKTKTTVSVTTTPQKILAANANRKSITVFNNDTLKNVYIDTDNVINTASAVAKLPAKKLFIQDIPWLGDYYAMAESGTISLDVEEYI